VNSPEGETNKKPHRNLMAWQKSMDFVVEVYRTTGKFPAEELYGLTAQLRLAEIAGQALVSCC
jgi:hypothetical protein